MCLKFITLLLYSQGGESTSEEMCLSFIVYYPEVPINYCVSFPRTDQYEGWVQKHAP